MGPDVSRSFETLVARLLTAFLLNLLAGDTGFGHCAFRQPSEKCSLNCLLTALFPLLPPRLALPAQRALASGRMVQVQRLDRHEGAARGSFVGHQVERNGLPRRLPARRPTGTRGHRPSDTILTNTMR